MQSIIKYILRSLKKQKITTFTIILSLMLVAAVILVNLGASTVTQEAYEAFIHNSSGKTDFIVSGNGTSNAFFLKDSINCDDVPVDQLVCMTMVKGVVRADDGKKQKMTIFGAAPDELVALKLLGYDNFPLSEPFDGDAIIIGEDMSELISSEEQEVAITINGEEHIFSIYATAKRAGLFYDDENNPACIVPQSTLNKLLGVDKKQSNVAYIAIEEDADIEVAQKNLTENNDTLKVSSVFDSDYLNTISTSMNMILMFSLVLLLYLSSIVIYSLYHHMLEVRTPIMASFRSLGASKVKTALALYLEALLFGVLGGGLGVLIGFAVAGNLYQSLLNSSVTFETISTKVSFLHILLTIFLTAGWAVITTSTAIWKTTRISIKQTLFQTQRTVATLSKPRIVVGFLFSVAAIVVFQFHPPLLMAGIATVLAISGCLLLTPFVVHLSCKLFGFLLSRVNEKISFAIMWIARNKLTMKTIVILSLAISLVISLFSVLGAADDLFNYTTDSLYFDIIIGTDPTSEKDYNEIENMDSVKKVFPLYSSDVDVKKDDEVLELNVIAYDNQETFGLFLGDAIKFLDPVTTLNDDEILLDEKYAEKHGYSIGDTVLLITEDEEMCMRLTGTVNSFRFSNSRSLGIISKNVYLEHFNSLPDTIYVLAKNDISETENEIKDYLLDTASMVANKSDFFMAQKKDNDTMLRIVEVAIILGLVVSCLGIINNIVINYLSRKKEFAILLSTTLTKHQLKTMLLTEALFTVVQVLVIAIVFSNVIIFTLSKLLETANVYLEMGYPWDAICMVGAVAAVIVLSSLFVPFKILKRINIYNELRME